MIQQTLDRLLPLADAKDVWVITNNLLDEVIGQQLPRIPKSNILSEPVARNTAPACALAAFLLERTSPDTVVGIFPSDHVVKDVARFVEVIKAGVAIAASGERIVVLGVPPTRAETGYGYIELCETVGPECVPCQGVPVRRVKRFTEKPDRARAEEFVASGNYSWNGGIFLWSARTLANAIREHCPEMGPVLERIAAAREDGDSELDAALEFERVFAEEYPLCQNISVDYAVLEPRSAKGELRSEIYCLPADFGWNDIGSWAALDEHRAGGAPDHAAEVNICDGVVGQPVEIDAQGNYVYAPGKTIALVGVHDLVIVETEDALLITTRERSQDVGKVVAELKARGREDLV